MSMRIMQTNSYLSSQNTIKYTGNQNTLKHGSNQNNSKILVSGTSTNKNRQADTAKKENSLGKMIEDLKTAAEDYGKYINDILEHNSAAARKFAEMIKGSTDEIEKIREEKTEQNRQVQEADGVETEKIVEGAAVSTNTISDTKISSEITDSAVVKELEYAPISAYRIHASLVNSHFDVKL